MPSFAEAFVRLRVDGRQLRSDAVKALQSADVKAEGATAGKRWLAGFGTRISHVSDEITKGLILGAAGVAVASAKMAIGFQEGLTSLVTGAGVAEDDLNMIADGIKRIAVESGTSTKQLIAGEYMIASAGYTGADGLKVLRAAAEGAKTGNADLGVVANAVTTVLKDYHLRGVDATRVTSQLVSTVAHGKVHLEDLASSLARVLPTAAALGLSFPQVGGAMATMTARGTSARLAAMGLNATLLALAAPTAGAVKQMNLLGLSHAQAARYEALLAAGHTKHAKALLLMGTTAKTVSETLTKHGLIAALQMVNDLALKAGPRGSVAYVAALKSMLGGTNGLRVGLQLTGKSLADTAANTRAIGKATGDAGGHVRGFALVQQDAAFKLARFRSEAEVAGISIGQKLLPPLTTAMDFVGSHTSLVLTLTAAVAGLAVAISVGTRVYAAYNLVSALCTKIALGTRVQLAGLKIAQLASAAASRVAAAAQWLWNAAMDANPLGLVVLAIAALVAAIIYAYTHFKWFRDFVTAGWHSILLAAKMVGSWFTGPFVRFFTKTIPAAFRWFVDTVLGLLGWIIHAAASAFGWIPGLGGKLRAAATQFDIFRDNVNAALGGVRGRTVQLSVAFNTLSPGASRRAPTGYAGGGLVTGPGTGTSDTAGLYWLSDKEFVHNAAAVAHYGVAFMDAVNRRQFPKMAAGGRPGLTVHPRTPSRAVIQAAIWPPLDELAKIALASGLIAGMLGELIAQYALSFAGRVPYLWGGTTPAGWDCSGFSGFVLRHFGYAPPRTAGGQQAWAAPVPVPVRGGLAFFAGADGSAGFAGHVGIVLGPNSMVNAYGAGYGTIVSPIYGSSGAVGGFGIPPGGRFHDGGILPEAIAGIGLRTGRGYQLAAREGVIPERGLAALAMLPGLLSELIAAVQDNSGDTAVALASVLGDAAGAARHQALYSARG
jgi:TP901 family phage tail tape measure protein